MTRWTILNLNLQNMITFDGSLRVYSDTGYSDYSPDGILSKNHTMANLRFTLQLLSWIHTSVTLGNSHYGFSQRLSHMQE